MQQSFGEMLESEMTRTGLSNVDLAEKIGMNRVTVSRLKTGRYVPSIDAFRRLVRVLPGLIAYIYAHNETAAPRIATVSKETTTHVRRPSKRP